jgi:GNAT superfamily N-acetyltransferase
VTSNQDQSRISPPEKLNSIHQIEDFDSGIEPLDSWLKRRALGNEAEGASRTYVVCVGDIVLGYYCLSSGAFANNVATGKVRASRGTRPARNMPDPIPVMIIGRLAVDRHWQGKGIGRGLLRDAVLRTLKAAEIVGIRAILVHAISAEAKQFYEQYRFTASSLEPLTLMVKVSDVAKSLGLPE